MDPDTVSGLANLYFHQAQMGATDAEIDAATARQERTLAQLAGVPAQFIGDVKAKLEVFWAELDFDTGGPGSDDLLTSVLADIDRLAPAASASEGLKRGRDGRKGPEAASGRRRAFLGHMPD